MFSRTAATYSQSRSMPLSVTSVAINGCGWSRCSHLSRPAGCITVSGIPSRTLMPRSIFIHVKPIAMRSFARRPYSFGIQRLGGVGVDADRVAPLAAQHLVDGNVVDLARNIPQRHLHRAHAACLARAAAELGDLLKEIVDAERILAERGGSSTPWRTAGPRCRAPRPGHRRPGWCQCGSARRGSAPASRSPHSACR